jgi:calcineurin-like phosphoesterase family protein
MKLKLTKTGPNIWFTSDTHYSHKNICRGVSEWTTNRFTRDYPNLDKMNDVIVNNINAVVQPDDILFHLGDWSFGGIENVSKFRERISCQNVHLILGNHDHHIKKNTNNLQDLFASVNQMLTVQIAVDRSPKLIADSRYELTLSHFPIASWENMNKGAIHLHGHVHLRRNQRLHDGKSMDVGVDGNDLHPHNLRDILSIMEKQPIAKLTLPKDHHEEEM